MLFGFNTLELRVPGSPVTVRRRVEELGVGGGRYYTGVSCYR